MTGKKFRVKYLLPMAKAESNIFMNILHLYTHWQMYWYFVWIIEIACISCFNKKHQKDNNKNKNNNTPPPKKMRKKKKKRLLSCSLSNRPCRIYIWCSAVFVSTPDFPKHITSIKGKNVQIDWVIGFCYLLMLMQVWLITKCVYQ